MVYSISRLNTYHNCPFAFYLTYKEKVKNDDNIYSYAGSKIHDMLDKIYSENKEYDISEIEEEFEFFLMDAMLSGYEFPSENIENNWVADMKHFVKHYNPMNVDVLASEERVLFQIGDIWIQGYIDFQTKNEDGSINIIDWKTSSKFTGARLKEAGRQLLIYKLAKEAHDNNVDSIGWYMIKYLNITYNLKNGKEKTSMYPRREWVFKLSKTLLKMLNDWSLEQACNDIINNHTDMVNDLVSRDRKISNRYDSKDYVDLVNVAIERYDGEYNISKMLSKYGYDEYYNEMLVEESIINNSIDNLPKEFQELFTVEDCIVWYEHNDEDIEEAIQYVKNTVAEIKSKNANDARDWTPKGVMENDFYCKHLCDQRKNCPYSLTEEEKNSDSNDDIPF